jgi:uncharacterized protein YcbK (DUF882 family)
MAQSTKNFKVSEFACKHCGWNEITQTVMDAAQEIRDAVGKPVNINSGCRCATHNKAVGSSSPNHTSGKAMDISCPGMSHHELFEVIKKADKPGTALRKMEFIYKEGGWIHLDHHRKRTNGRYQVQ